MAQEVCLKGLLIPKDWHHNGRVKAVALATDDEKEIFIRIPPRKQITHYLRHQVELWGAFDDPQDPTVFHVRRLRSLNLPA